MTREFEKLKQNLLELGVNTRDVLLVCALRAGFLQGRGFPCLLL